GAAARTRNFGLIAPLALIFAIVAERMRPPLRAAWNYSSAQSSWPGLSRPSTSWAVASPKDADARHKAGHDDGLEAAPACRRTQLPEQLVEKRERVLRFAALDAAQDFLIALVGGDVALR